MPKRDRTPTCLADQDDGTRCRTPATILDPERGGLVCWRHDPARADRFGWSDGDITITPPPEDEDVVWNETLGRWEAITPPPEEEAP